MTNYKAAPLLAYHPAHLLPVAASFSDIGIGRETEPYLLMLQTNKTPAAGRTMPQHKWSKHNKQTAQQPAILRRIDTTHSQTGRAESKPNTKDQQRQNSTSASELVSDSGKSAGGDMSHLSSSYSVTSTGWANFENEKPSC